MNNLEVMRAVLNTPSMKRGRESGELPAFVALSDLILGPEGHNYLSAMCALVSLFVTATGDEGLLLFLAAVANYSGTPEIAEAAEKAAAKESAA